MPLLQAVLCLAAAQKLHTVSAPLRLAASALWGLLGAPRLACAEFAALDVKNIQLTSVTGAGLVGKRRACSLAGPGWVWWQLVCPCLLAAQPSVVEA